MTTENDILRALPSVDRMLACPVSAALMARLGHNRVRDMLREIVEGLRSEVASGQARSTWIGNGERDPLGTGGGLADRLSVEIERRLEAAGQKAAVPSLRRIINATGVVLHTNLGRAPLAPEAIDRVQEIARGYSNLEFDLDLGERGRREAHCQEHIARLTGAEAAAVVNNNAAAVLLVLNTLAEGGEVIVSRGELVEIGGSFRIPDVMQKSGAVLREVGTTNRTRVADYVAAINDRTRLILRVHPSNYRIIGFTERPSSAEIASVAREHGLPSFEDLGSGCLVDLSSHGVSDEPVVRDSISAGLSVVSFSGDKLAGGPQAGIIAGSKETVRRLLKNPLMRALRVDKMTYAALETTLALYVRGSAEQEVPVLKAICSTLGEVTRRAESLAARLAQIDGIEAVLEPGHSLIGGGSAPAVKLPTAIVAISHDSRSAVQVGTALRRRQIPIVARTERDLLLIDLRTVAPEDESEIVDALRNAGLIQAL